MSTISKTRAKMYAHNNFSRKMDFDAKILGLFSWRFPRKHTCLDDFRENFNKHADFAKQNFANFRQNWRNFSNFPISIEWKRHFCFEKKIDLLAWVVEPWKGWEEGRFAFCQLEGVGAEYTHPEQCAPTSLIFRKRPFKETVSRDGFVSVVSSGVSVKFAQSKSSLWEA